MENESLGLLILKIDKWNLSGIFFQQLGRIENAEPKFQESENFSKRLLFSMDENNWSERHRVFKNKGFQARNFEHKS